MWCNYLQHHKQQRHKSTLAIRHRGKVLGRKALRVWRRKFLAEKSHQQLNEVKRAAGEEKAHISSQHDLEVASLQVWCYALLPVATAIYIHFLLFLQTQLREANRRAEEGENAHRQLEASLRETFLKVIGNPVRS